MFEAAWRGPGSHPPGRLFAPIVKEVPGSGVDLTDWPSGANTTLTFGFYLLATRHRVASTKGAFV